MAGKKNLLVNKAQVRAKAKQDGCNIGDAQMLGLSNRIGNIVGESCATMLKVGRKNLRF